VFCLALQRLQSIIGPMSFALAAGFRTAFRSFPWCLGSGLPWHHDLSGSEMKACGWRMFFN
jgi:hypothetical protein